MSTRRQSARAGARAGLTLVEVMLAMVILGLGIFVLVEGAARCLAVIRVTRNYQTAHAVLDQGELEYPVIQKQEEGEDELSVYNLQVGPVEYPNGFSFQRSAEESDEEGLIVLRTRVSWSEHGRESGEEVVSFLYYTNELAF